MTLKTGHTGGAGKFLGFEGFLLKFPQTCQKNVWATFVPKFFMRLYFGWPPNKVHEILGDILLRFSPNQNFWGCNGTPVSYTADWLCKWLICLGWQQRHLRRPTQ